MKPVLERLGLADPLVAIAFDILDERVDALKNLAVLRLPPEVVLPGARVPYQLHSARSCRIPSPCSRRSIDASSRRAFSGLFRRWAVSFRDS